MAYTVKRKNVQTFDFNIEGSDKVYHVPVLSALPVNTLKKANELRKSAANEEEANDRLFDFFVDIFDEEAKGIFDLLTGDDIIDLFAAYLEASTTPAANAGE